MRILHVLDTLDHHPGRFSVGFPGLVSALRDSGATSDVVSGVSHDEWVEDALAAENVAIVDEDDPNTALGELGLLMKAADVVHLHTARAEIAKLAVASARAAHRPYLLSPWGELGGYAASGPSLARWWDARRFRRTYVDARYVTCASEAERALAAAQRLHPRLAVLPAGFDEPHGPPAEPDSETEAMQMPWTDGRPMAAMLGDLDGTSGLDELIRAVAALPAARTWHFVAAGRPVDHWLPRFQQEIEQHRLTEQFALVVYPDVAQQAAIVAAAAFILLVSTAPTSPTGLLQGMRAAKPVLVSTTSGAADLAAESAGIVAAAGAEGLRRALESMLSMSEGERRTLGDRAAERAKQQWSWNALVPQYLTLYDRAK